MNKAGLSGVMLLALFFGGCGNSDTPEETTVRKEPYEKTEFLMGTYVTVRVYDEGKEAVLEKAFDRVEALADKITVNEAGSEIDAVNAAAGTAAVELSDDVYPLVRSAWDYSEASDGDFDLSIGPITELWHIGFDDARKPEQIEIDAALTLVDYERVVLDDKRTDCPVGRCGHAVGSGCHRQRLHYR